MSLYHYLRSQPTSLRDPFGTYPGFTGHGNVVEPLNAAMAIFAIQNGADRIFDVWMKRVAIASPAEAKRLEAYRGLFRYLALLVNNGTNDKNRFVYTCGCGWIDTGHLLNNAEMTALGGRVIAWAASLINELGQAFAGSDSAFTPEDLLSNKIGRDFGAGGGMGGDIAEGYDRLLINCGAVNWDAPAVQGKSVAEWLEVDMQAARDLYRDRPEDFRVISAKGAREYFEKSTVHNCLCDGNKPKHPAHQYRGVKEEMRKQLDKRIPDWLKRGAK